jgi:signal peptidase I
MPKKKAHASPPHGGSRSARSESRKSSDRQEAPSKRGGWHSWFSVEAIRELVEAVVIAFALAFFVRTFEAEAFVIPTGSMAPTLMGRHKDLVCSKCGYHYQVTASAEVNPKTGRLLVDADGTQWVHVVAATCPNCRFPMDLTPGNPQGKTYRSFKGDRILVAKFPYHLANPDRWDVAVFAYPGEARTNYIKRLVGLPNETLSIHRGDLFVQPSGTGSPRIARKPPHKILAMMQPVYDNDHVAPEMVRQGWPLRWVAEPAQGPGAWQVSEDLKRFRTEGTSSGEAWLGYHHYVPTPEDWRTVLQGGRFDVRSGYPKPQLITDFACYNTAVVQPTQQPNPSRFGLHWVGDLVLECTVEVQSQQGQFLMALVEGGRVFRCELDVATGRTTLFVDGSRPFQTAAETRVRGPGKYDLRFANVDDQLVLWVNGSVVDFDPKPEYDPIVEPAGGRAVLEPGRLDGTGESLAVGDPEPTEADLQPARIGSRALAATVSHVRLFRDVYYIATRSTFKQSDYELPPELSGSHALASPTAQSLAAMFSDPDQWSFFRYRRQVWFTLQADEFFMLGDNSAESKDSRLWESDDDTPYFVRRDLLKGKALWIYWPHSWDRIPGSDKIPWFPNGIWFPLFPNFCRMGFVR